MTTTEHIHSRQNEAETAVLGALITEPALYAEAAGIIEADDFTLPFHKIIFAKIGELYGKAETIDTVILLENLIAANDDERIEAKEYIMRLVDSVPMIGNLKYYCEYVKDKAIGRRAMDILREADFKGISGESISDTVQEVAEKLAGLVRDKGSDRIQTIKDALLEIQQDVFVESEDLSIKTGFYMLDKILDGIEPGDLVAIGARTSVGKSAFALQMIASMAKSGKKVMLYSLEMTAKQNVQRILSRLSGVEMKNFRRYDRTNEPVKKQILEAFEIVHKYVINISAVGGLRVSDIALDCVKYPDTDVIVIDHVGLMRGERGAKQSRYEEITQIAIDLRSLALRVKKPIIMLSQLNREAKNEPSKRGKNTYTEPQLHHLRDSGELEQSAGTIIFLWRMPDYDQTGMLGASVAKNRQGGTGKINLKFDAATMTFREVLDYSPPSGYNAAEENDLEEILF